MSPCFGSPSPEPSPPASSSQTTSAGDTALLLRLGHRGRRLRHDGRGGQCAHRLLAALPADPRRVRLGAGRDGRSILFRLSRLGGSEPLPRPPDGSPRTAGRDRAGRGTHGGGVDAGPAGAPAVASLRHARRPRRRGQRLSGLYRSGALPSQLVRPTAGPGHQRGLLWRRRGLDHPAAWLQHLIGRAGWRASCWALGILSLAGIPGQIALGHLSDRIGRECVWTAGSLGFALCYVALLLLRHAPTPTLLYLMVVSQGMLGYGLTSVVGAIPAEIFQA